MIKKIALLSIVISASYHLVNAQEVPAIKSTDPLVGKGIFQGNLNLSFQNVKNNFDTRPDPVINNLNALNIGLNGLFGRIDSNKVIKSSGFNITIVRSKIKEYQKIDDPAFSSLELNIKAGPTFGSGKFITITDKFYYAPTTTFNIYGIIERNILKRQTYSSSGNENVEDTKTKGFGGGSSIVIVPLRLAYLWNDNLLFTVSIGNIGAQLEYIKSNKEQKLTTTRFATIFENGVPKNITITDITSFTASNDRFNANIIGGISNFASFGISYLFK